MKADNKKHKVRVVKRYTVVCRNEEQPDCYVDHHVEHRELVLFKGSLKAFEIWQRGHLLPPDAEVTNTVKG